jgi:catechol-2,3-dioxygenase
VQNFAISGCCLLVADVARSTEFYTQKVGFELVRSAVGFAQYRTIGGVHLSTWQADHFYRETGLVAQGTQVLNKTMPALLLPNQMALEDCYRELQSRGVVFSGAPRWYPWNAYCAYFDDPDGNIWELLWWPPERASKAPPVAVAHQQGTTP